MHDTRLKPDFSQIIKNNPAGYILRSNLTKATGGLLHGRTMANLDSMGIGIKGRISIGRKVAYKVEAVVEYLQSKVTVNPSNTDDSLIDNEKGGSDGAK